MFVGTLSQYIIPSRANRRSFLSHKPILTFYEHLRIRTTNNALFLLITSLIVLLALLFSTVGKIRGINMYLTTYKKANRFWILTT